MTTTVSFASSTIVRIAMSVHVLLQLPSRIMMTRFRCMFPDSTPRIAMLTVVEQRAVSCQSSSARRWRRLSSINL